MFIEPNSQNRGTLSFKAHLPSTFGGVMNCLYKKAEKISRDTFEIADTVRVSTKLDNGKNVSASVNFLYGKYIGFSMDEGAERYRKEFIKTVIEKFKKSVAKGRLRKKLGYNE